MFVGQTNPNNLQHLPRWLFPRRLQRGHVDWRLNDAMLNSADLKQAVWPHFRHRMQTGGHGF